MAGFSKAVVSFSAAEFGAVTEANPLELVAAPGAGRYIAVRDLDVIMLKTTRTWQPRGNSALALGTEPSLIPMLSAVLIGGTGGAEESTVGVGTGAGNSGAWVFGADAGENQPLTFTLVEPDVQGANGGPIIAASVADGGSGYAPGDTGTIDDPAAWAFGATYVVDTVDGGGAVLTFTVTDPGTAYGVGTFPTSHTTGGGNDDFTVDITSVASGDSPVKFIVYYTIEDL